MKQQRAWSITRRKKRTVLRKVMKCIRCTEWRRVRPRKEQSSAENSSEAYACWHCALHKDTLSTTHWNSSVATIVRLNENNASGMPLSSSRRLRNVGAHQARTLHLKLQYSIFSRCLVGNHFLYERERRDEKMAGQHVDIGTTGRDGESCNKLKKNYYVSCRKLLLEDRPEMRKDDSCGLTWSFASSTSSGTVSRDQK